jgi:hypothetical protein
MKFGDGETSIAIAQESQPNVNTTTQNNTTSIPLDSTEIELGSDDKPMVVTWLETNSSKIDCIGYEKL